MPSKEVKKEDKKSLEELFPKIAHEIGNPLTSIISLASILERTSEAGAPFSQSIVSEAWKINRLVEKVSVYSGNRQSIKNDSIIEELVQTSIDRFFARGSKETKEKANRISILAKDKTILPIDEEQLRILIEEAVSNALDHGTLETDNKAEELLLIEVDKSETHLKLSFRNKLIEDKQINLTNKVGIGLEVIDRIAKQHDGSSSIKKENESFTLEILLPLKEEGSEKKNETLSFSWKDKAISILLIDDDQNILTVMEKILSYSFTQLLEANECTCYCESPESAVSLLESDIQIDLLICDKNLSTKQNNGDVMEELLAKAPQLRNRCIRMSGEAPKQGETFPFLAKPFSSQELLAIVKEVLSSEQ